MLNPLKKEIQQCLPGQKKIDLELPQCQTEIFILQNNQMLFNKLIL